MPLRARRARREARAELRRLYRPRRGDGGALSPLRVAHLLPTLEIGGKERSVVDLCACAPALGIDPLIVTYDPLPAGRRALDPAAEHVALDRRDPGFAGALRTAVSRADVLHAHGHVSAVYAPDTVPAVATIHAALGSWRWLPAVVPALRRMERLTAVSADLARATRRMTLRNVAVIATGIDTNKFLPGTERGTARRLVEGGCDTRRLARAEPPLRHAAHGPPPRAGEELVVGIAARLHPVKRHVDLFAAIRRLGVRLLVAGDGPLDAALRAAAPPNVAFLGPVADMPAFYRALDLFVLCSDHEGMPLALLEAMASGLPCIATRAGGMRELIGDGTHGITGVPRRDPRALAQAIAALADPDRRARDGAAARAASLSRSLAAQAAAYAALYRALA